MSVWILVVSRLPFPSFCHTRGADVGTDKCCPAMAPLAFPIVFGHVQLPWEYCPHSVLQLFVQSTFNSFLISSLFLTQGAFSSLMLATWIPRHISGLVFQSKLNIFALFS